MSLPVLLPGTLTPLPCLFTPLCPTVPPWSQEDDKDIGKFHSTKEEAFSILPSSSPSSSKPSHHTQPSDFPASNEAILLNISKKYSLTPSLFIYKNQLNTLLLCSIWKLEQPGLYLAEILLFSPHIPAQPDELEGLGKKEGRGC